MTIEEAWLKFILLVGSSSRKSKDLYEFLDGRVENLNHLKIEDLSAFISEEKQAYYREHGFDRTVERILDILPKFNIQTIAIDHEDYPQILKEIYDPPWVLFYRGARIFKDFWGVGVVGTRKCDVYGRKLAFEWGETLAQNYIPVVSGLARGIDSFAHAGCIERQGKTIAVLGHGLDQVYPRDNIGLADRILENQGTLLSEYPPLIEPLPHHFPARNRIINGLSKGIIVVQADVKSGSLITADFAMESGRTVWAIPGRPCDDSFKGCNQLIRDGATMLLEIEDITQTIGLNSKNLVSEKTLVELNFDCDDEKKIYNTLSYDALSQEELFAKMNMEYEIFIKSIFNLELKGMIMRHPGQLWTRA